MDGMDHAECRAVSSELMCVHAFGKSPFVDSHKQRSYGIRAHHLHVFETGWGEAWQKSLFLCAAERAEYIRVLFAGKTSGMSSNDQRAGERRDEQKLVNARGFFEEFMWI